MKKSLYFIALLPPEEIMEDVKKLKEDIARKYHSKHALKLPAHITLQIPFRMEEEKEVFLKGLLEEVAEGQEKFEVELRNFGAFPPRVIYVEVGNPRPLMTLFSSLNEVLEKNTERSPREKTNSIHPHISLATRDLNRENFQRAWNEFKGRSFQRIFTANSMVLFKHNSKTWDIHTEFVF